MPTTPRSLCGECLPALQLIVLRPYPAPLDVSCGFVFIILGRCDQPPNLNLTTLSKAQQARETATCALLRKLPPPHVLHSRIKPELGKGRAHRRSAAWSWTRQHMGADVIVPLRSESIASHNFIDNWNKEDLRVAWGSPPIRRAHLIVPAFLDSGTDWHAVCGTSSTAGAGSAGEVGVNARGQAKAQCVCQARRSAGAGGCSAPGVCRRRLGAGAGVGAGAGASAGGRAGAAGGRRRNRRRAQAQAQARAGAGAGRRRRRRAKRRASISTCRCRQILQRAAPDDESVAQDVWDCRLSRASSVDEARREQQADAARGATDGGQRPPLLGVGR